MSKNIFPTASIFIRAVVEAVFGIVTVSLPSFGVELAKTVLNDSPLSVDSKILTFAALTGAAVVFATVQVMVCEEFPFIETPVFGDVTTKGPLLASTAT